MIACCTKFYYVMAGDGCWAIADAHSIALSDFYIWNPEVGNECQHLLPQVYVCVGRDASVTQNPTSLPWTSTLTRPSSTSSRVSGTAMPSTTTAVQPPASARPSPPGPTQIGIPANCNRWLMQKADVYCYDMAAVAGIALSELYALNPALNGDCSGLWVGYAYCVGTG